jgi:beta-glucosidase
MTTSKTISVSARSVAIALAFFTFAASANADMSALLYKDASAPIEKRIDDLLSRMTIQEKARQLDLYKGHEYVDKILDRHAAAADAKLKTETVEKAWGDIGVGGIHDLYPHPDLYNQMQGWIIQHQRLGIPALFIEEGLHGYMGYDETIFPQSINLGTTFNTDLARRTGAAIAAEARADGIGMILGPVCCLARDPRWGRVEETFGEDPYLSGQVALNYVLGMQGDSLNSDHTVVAEPKHFAGHGSPESGINQGTVHVGEREMRMVMLKSFEPAIRQGHAMGVMAAYHNIDGVPCAADPWLLTTVLRDEWGFQGFVLSDLGATRRLYSVHHVAATPRDAIVMALSAGLDMQFYDFDHDLFQKSIVDAVNEGQLPQSVVDQAVRRVLRVKFELGLFDHPFVDPSVDTAARRNPQHLDLALQSARQSMCLLKNENNLLPLTKNIGRIALLGMNAGKLRLGDYSDPGEKENLPSMREAIAAISPKTEILYSDGEDIPAAVALAKQADVVILGLGEFHGISGEHFDRAYLDFSGNQEQLLEAVAAAGKPTVLVLQNGRPITINWAHDHVGAILEAWYPGERGSQAIAETLFGDNNPAGRLPVSFPKSVGQLPDYYDRDISMQGKYIDGDLNPLYPFGFGLSYTTFRYGEPSVSPAVIPPTGTVTVSTDVTNTGSVEGDEVVQLYLRKTTASVVPFAKQLKGFSRIHLKPGETATVSFKLTPDDLEIWGAKREWSVESGPYVVTVGPSSDQGKKVSFSVSE